MSTNIFQDVTAVVTGGTRGIGFAIIAARLLEEGARVAICASRQKSVDEAIPRLVQRAGESNHLMAQVADVSNLNDVKNFATAVLNRFGTVGILVNNAGAGIFKGVAELSPEEWHRMIGLNLTGVYNCCHEFLPIMRTAGKGDVINISSLAGRNAFAGGAGYNASKFGLNGFSEAMMLDYRNDGIRVSTVMPGSVDTEFGSSTGHSNAEHNSWKVAPQDIADTVVCLLRMPRRTTISEIHIRPSRPPVKKS
jgi:3-oxoacyl-[acyl-carrier protein] reductase